MYTIRQHKGTLTNASNIIQYTFRQLKGTLTHPSNIIQYTVRQLKGTLTHTSNIIQYTVRQLKGTFAHASNIIQNTVRQISDEFIFILFVRKRWKMAMWIVHASLQMNGYLKLRPPSPLKCMLSSKKLKTLKLCTIRTTMRSKLDIFHSLSLKFRKKIGHFLKKYSFYLNTNWDFHF